MPWERPSARVAELMRLGIETQLTGAEGEFFDSVDSASLAEHHPDVAEDPTLLASLRRVNRATIMHWAEANLRDPGREVPAYGGPEVQALVRDLVRRGFDAQAIEPYRAAQNAAWQVWMNIAFSLTDDAAELQELLQVSARSIFSYVDANMASTVELVLREREELLRGTNADRLETLTLILDGAPLQLPRAERRLGWAFDRTHVAAIIWSDRPEVEQEDLERVAAEVARAIRAGGVLTVEASGGSVWLWGAVDGGADEDLTGLEALLGELPHVRVALGSPASGIDGFRRSHADAYAAQRLIARLGSPARIARFEELRVVAAVTQDEGRARELVADALGELEHGPKVVLETLRTYLRTGLNASRAAELLHAHRNTIVARLAKAEDLLPRPLGESILDVHVALEILHWRGEEE